MSSKPPSKTSINTLKFSIKTLLNITIFSIFFSLIAGCANDDTDGPAASGQLIQSDTTKLTDYFQESIKRDLQESSQDGANREGRPTDSTSSPSSENSSDTGKSVSNTNIQEQGVDEADLIKTNGRYIYSVTKRYQQDTYYDNGGADTSSTSPAPEDAGEAENADKISDIIRIMDTEGTESLTEIKSFSNSVAPWSIAGLYLHQTENLLIALTSLKSDYASYWFDSGYFTNQNTDIMLIDIKDPTAASIKTTLSFEGQLIDSRRNGDTLYMVLRYYPDYQYTTDDKLESTTAQDFLPRYNIDKQNKQLITQPENCYLEKGQKGSSDIITLVAIDLKSETPVINSRCYVGSAEALYVSQEALYLATTRWQYEYNNEVAAYSNATTTDIHKFKYTGLDFDYRGSGEINGHLGYQQDKKSFRFSEYEGYLRVITLDEYQWTNTSTTESDVADSPPIPDSKPDTSNSLSKSSIVKSPVLLSILEEDPNEKSLKLVAKLPNSKRPEPIGKPQEQLYATRFIGKRAYAVTFRVTDPIYVLNLDDPADPFIAGELEIDGYSNYLHPISENLLLGIGKDAVPSTSNDRGDGRGAWYQGVKLSLIDVTDANNPIEVDKIIIGKRGTDSTALYNHHGVTGLKVNDKYRVTIPVNLHAGTRDSYDNIQRPSDYYAYQHTGLYRYEIDINSQKIEALPAMVILDSTSLPSNAYYNAPPVNNDRSVLIDNTVYYMHDGQLWLQNWLGTDEIIGPK